MVAVALSVGIFLPNEGFVAWLDPERRTVPEGPDFFD